MTWHDMTRVTKAAQPYRAIAVMFSSHNCITFSPNRVRKVVSLGSPHNPPPSESAMAKIDQTRGLLRYITENFPGQCSFFSCQLKRVHPSYATKALSHCRNSILDHQAHMKQMWSMWVLLAQELLAHWQEAGLRTVQVREARKTGWQVVLSLWLHTPVTLFCLARERGVLEMVSQVRSSPWTLFFSLHSFWWPPVCDITYVSLNFDQWLMSIFLFSGIIPVACAELSGAVMVCLEVSDFVLQRWYSADDIFARIVCSEIVTRNARPLEHFSQQPIFPSLYRMQNTATTCHFQVKASDCRCYGMDREASWISGLIISFKLIEKIEITWNWPILFSNIIAIALMDASLLKRFWHAKNHFCLFRNVLLGSTRLSNMTDMW